MKISLPAPAKARIEMLPLIDIVFLLLVVFIQAMLSMAVHRGLAVELPVSQAAKTDTAPPLAVTVQRDAHGQTRICVDKEPVSPARLGSVLRARAAEFRRRENREPAVLLFADKTIPYAQVFQVLDTVRLAGLGRVSLEAEEGAPAL